MLSFYRLPVCNVPPAFTFRPRFPAVCLWIDAADYATTSQLDVYQFVRGCGAGVFRHRRNHLAVQGVECSGSPKLLRLACALSVATGAHCKLTGTGAPNRIDPLGASNPNIRGSLERTCNSLSKAVSAHQTHLPTNTQDCRNIRQSAIFQLACRQRLCA